MKSTLARPSGAGGIRWSILLTLLMLSCLVPRKALAQAVTGLTIRWDAPPRCPLESDVTERVRKLIGTSTAAQGSLQADGTITQADDGRFHLKLVLRSGGLVGERSIDSRSCADLTRAAAVAIALLLRSDEPLSEGALSDGHALDGAHEGESTGGPAANPAERQPPENRPTASNLPKQPEPPEHPREGSEAPVEAASHHEYLRLRAPLAALSVGPLPRPEWGISFGVGTAYAKWRFWLEGSEWLAEDVPSRDFPGYSANVKRVTASLKGCRASRFSMFEVAPCALVALEHVSAVGSGMNVVPQSQHVSWIAAGVGGQARVYLSSWFSLALSVDAIVETSRPRISIGGVGLVDQLAPAAFTAMLGPEWIL